MDTVSLPLYHPGPSRWRTLASALALLWLLALLAFAVGAVEIAPIAPADGVLVGPWRWQAIGPGEG